jgi:P-type Cu2+ transporter
MPGLAEASLRISGMHCASCADVVERALQRVPGVVTAQVSAAAQCASVRWDPARTRAASLVDAVRCAGYEAAPDTSAVARSARGKEARTALWRLFVAAFCAVQVMMLTEPAYLSAPGDLPIEYKRLLDWGAWVLTLPVLCFSAAPFFAGAWRSISQRHIGMDVPVSLGIAVAFLAGTGATFDPAGPFGRDVYFDSVTMFIAFLLGGRYLEMKARHRAEAALDDTTTRLPRTVMRVGADGSTTTVDATELQPGDRVRVPYGEAFAADGVVAEGSTAADESLLTGESAPVSKRPGDAVVAGSLNVGAPILMRVERTGADTRYEAITALMRAARRQKPAIVAAADRWAAPFLWAVLVLAAAAGIVWHEIDPSNAVRVVVSVLIVTCPCALSLAAPSALLAAASAMGRQGLLLSNLDAIARLARIQTLFVDKTGTLTSGRHRCAGVEFEDQHETTSIDILAKTAASLAGWSNHPLSIALHAAFDSQTISWRNVNESPGRGMEGVDEHAQHWQLGSAAWVHGDGGREAGSTEVVLGRDGRIVARFTFEEQLRDDAIEAVKKLRLDGVRVRLLSGDDPTRTRSAEKQLLLDSAQGGLLPEDKLRAVRDAQRGGELVAMVGDGVNDAPVLAQADVSIAMGEGAQVARAQADGVLISNRLADIVRARALARRALGIMRQNFVWAATYNALCVPLALAGWLPPWAAGLGMATSSLIVVANSLRLGR